MFQYFQLMWEEFIIAINEKPDICTVEYNKDTVNPYHCLLKKANQKKQWLNNITYR